MPTQIKLVYDVISNRINADYSYDIIFSDDQNMNYGFAEGYNRALEQVDAEYVVLLNSDVEVTPH